ncbi:MAG TPA: HAD-IIA family hydrolase, partial [Chloroflexota bacterium]|nr:HAD-IIA family hydrolase [Chloroflexota bacterium]
MSPSHDPSTSAGHRLAAISTFLIDLDGVVYAGNTALPGASEFFQLLAGTGRGFQCITNNSTLTAAQFVDKLAGMGIHVTHDHVLTSPQATCVYLAERFGVGARVFAIGEEGLVRALLGAGFRLVDARADVVVCGLDRRLTYDRLMRACFAIRGGAPLVATNPDLSLPSERGFLPGNGATLAYLRAATGVEPVVIGKPEATMLEIAMARTGASPHETAIIGDGLLTDILAGERAGVTKILLLTGVATQDDVAGAPAQPDFVFDDLPT